MKNPYVRFIPCECHGHALSVTTWSEDDDIYLEQWFLGNRKAGLWNKLKAAYQFFRDNEYCSADFIMERAEAEELIDILQEALNFAAVPQGCELIITPLRGAPDDEGILS